MFNVNYIINLILYIKVHTYLYFSFYLNDVEDCISEISIEKRNLYDFLENCVFINDCIYTNLNCYPNKGKPIIKNEPYNLGDIIYMKMYDNRNQVPYIDITIKINEYIIETKHKKFWKCLNCINENNYDEYEGSKFYFYTKYPPNNDFIFNSSFQINSILDLNYSGVGVNNSFYALNSSNNFDRELYFKNDEVELINFNITDNFYIKDNKSLFVNYTIYNFEVIFENDILGTLKGLNIDNIYTNITNHSYFKVNKTNGLIYRLNPKEKKIYTIILKLKITAYNYYLNRPVTNEEFFNFNITRIGDYLKCLNEEKEQVSKSIYHYFCPNLTKEKLINDISELISRADINKNYEINGSDIKVYISPINTIFFEGAIQERMAYCERTLRNYYNISSSEIITFMQIEMDNKNKLNYSYDEKRNILNLSLCNDDDICYNKVYYHYDNKTKKFYACLNKTKEQLIKNLSELLEDVEIGETYEIKGDDYSVKISPTNATYLSSVSHVNFTKCVDLLRNTYGLSPSRYITFLQLEINNTNSETLINKIEYQAYDHNKIPLNLSICENENIKVIHSIKSSSLFDTVSASLFKDLGIDIFNIKDSFFNDICHSYSGDSDNDMTLKNRIKKIFQNFSLCEEGCSYDEIDLGNMTVICDCKVKTNINVDNISVNFLPYKEKNSNFKIIKCYNLVFSSKDKSTNIGFWIFLVLVLTHIPFLILYFLKGIGPVREYIVGQMKKYGYIKKSKTTDKDLNKSNNNSIKKEKIKGENNKNNKKQKIGKKTASPPPKNKKIKQIVLKKKSNKSISAINVKTSVDNSKNLIGSKNVNVLLTQDKVEKKKISFKTKKSIKKEKSKNIFNFNIINININNKKRTYTPQDSNKILNNYTFEEAIKYDLRSICLIYYIILLSKQAIFHAFLFRSPLEIFPLRFCLLIFIYSSDLALNALFYLDDKISEKYEYAQSLFLFAFSNNITVILLSTLVGFLFMTLFTNLGNSTNEIRNVFRKEEEKLIKNKKYTVTDKRKKEVLNEIDKILKKYKIKMIILIIIEFSLMLFFWYYVTAFCHVYNKTQYSWLFDSFLSILSRTVIDFLLPMGLAKLYRLAVESNIKCLYKIVLFFYSFG